MRIAGGIEVLFQECRNRQALSQHGRYVILCVGESTTKGQYPGFLEDRLNKSAAGIVFKVINKGIASTNSTHILGNMEAYVDRYAPSMVVAMMGCNDARVLYYKDIPDAQSPAFTYSRAYRFLRLISAQAGRKVKEWQERVFSGHASGGRIRASEIFLRQGDPGRAEAILKHAAILSPGDSDIFLALGWFYDRQGRLAQAEVAYKEALALFPRDARAYDKLGRLYRVQARLPEAEEAFKKSIEFAPGSLKTYKALGWLYRTMRNEAAAEKAFGKMLEIDPHNADALMALGSLYSLQNKVSRAQAVYKKALAHHPGNENVYVEAIWFYLSRGRFARAQQLFEQAVSGGIKSFRFFKVGVALYEQSGRPDLAREYAQKARKLELQAVLPVTAANYRRLKGLLDKKGIRLVCVQYPMRSLVPLKEIFSNDPGNIIFVDNEQVFKDAVHKDGYAVYFKDLFGGDFGHCTTEGNWLLAGNVASQIIKNLKK